MTEKVENKVKIPENSELTEKLISELESALFAHGTFSHSYDHTSSVKKDEAVGEVIHHNLHGKRSFGDSYEAMSEEEIAAAKKATMSYTLIEVVGESGSKFVLKETARDIEGKIIPDSNNVTVGAFKNLDEFKEALEATKKSFVNGFDSTLLFNKSDSFRIPDDSGASLKVPNEPKPGTGDLHNREDLKPETPAVEVPGH